MARLTWHTFQGDRYFREAEILAVLTEIAEAIDKTAQRIQGPIAKNSMVAFAEFIRGVRQTIRATEDGEPTMLGFVSLERLAETLTRVEVPATGDR